MVSWEKWDIRPVKSTNSEGGGVVFTEITHKCGRQTIAEHYFIILHVSTLLCFVGDDFSGFDSCAHIVADARFLDMVSRRHTQTSLGSMAWYTFLWRRQQRRLGKTHQWLNHCDFDAYAVIDLPIDPKRRHLELVMVWPITMEL